MVAEKLPPNRTYWLSFDRWNQRVKYGRGYHMQQTTEKTWDFKEGTHAVASQLIADQRKDLFGPGVKLVGGSLSALYTLASKVHDLPLQHTSSGLSAAD
jgi:hypothetical protein